jgi:hypothetical protein
MAPGRVRPARRIGRTDVAISCGPRRPQNAAQRVPACSRLGDTGQRAQRISDHDSGPAKQFPSISYEYHMNEPDLDFDTIDGMDDADNDSLKLLVKDRTTGDFGWHWVYRDRLADHGLWELSRYGLPDE